MIEQLSAIDINQSVIEVFENTYKNAHILSYPDSKIIFNQYFNNTAPFKKSGEKKSEFPDAFIIAAVKKYLEEENKTILVLSSDGDWETAFSGMSDIIFTKSIDDAINLLQGETDIVEVLFKLLEEKIEEEINDIADFECYVVDDYELIDDDLEITSAKVDILYCDLVKLKVTNSTVIFKCFAKLCVDGRATVFDEEHSVWDSEDHEYVYQVNSEVEFKNAPADIEIEVEIDFDLEDIENTAEISKVRIINPYEISICLDKAETSWEQIYDEDY